MANRGVEGGRVRIVDALQAAELSLQQLRSLAAKHPELKVTRNPVGNYQIYRELATFVEDWGYVDMFGEGVVLDGDPE